MELDRNAMSDVDDTTVSISSSLHEMQTPSDDGSDAHGDGHAILGPTLSTPRRRDSAGSFFLQPSENQHRVAVHAR